ncbi:hypothetical protein COLU111180_00225 [Cohnella lubricantis]|uniref:Uncharacterized protein n=1 Tax=Cohnella lubricantis TaxID=2163172 RepID=A0A841T702_9BACL|nr:hypothetical protein [Cohnella lubricantis]MBB6677114.1 hypothetical protein [Cohnella lubricantis]MBP2118961.1 hypothetical protein [Cohnella lubricantis]
MNRFGKQTACTVAVLSLLLMGTACSNNNEPAAVSPSASAPAASSASASQDANEASPSPSASASADAETEAEAVQEGTGTYNGQIDNHSIEIEFGGEPTAFQIDSSVSEQISDWDAGITVTFQYKESALEADGQELIQRTIVSIDKQ